MTQTLIGSSGVKASFVTPKYFADTQKSKKECPARERLGRLWRLFF